MGVRGHRWVPVVLVAVAVSAAALATAGPGFVGPPAPVLRETPPPEAGGPGGSGNQRPQPEPQAGDESGFAAALLDVLFVIFAVLLGLAVLALLARLLYDGVRTLLTVRMERRLVERHRASQPTDADAEAEAEEVREAVRAGLAGLDAGDPRRAVIACWLRLERVAASAGTARMAADTPGDLTHRLLARHRVSRQALERLAEAYRRARYAPTEVTEDLAASSREALRAVHADLSASRPGDGDVRAAAGEDR